MRKFDASRWAMPFLAIMVSAGVSPAALAQSTDQTASEVSIDQPTAPIDQHFTQVPKDQPTPEEVGDAFAARQRYQAAIAAYDKVEVKSAAVWNKMGIAYQMMFNPKDAARCYKESLKLESRNSQVMNNLGTLYASIKDYSQADRLYRKALKIDPRSALVLKNLGTDLLAEHRYDQGWEAYQRALAIDPEIFSGDGSLKVQNPASVQQRGAMNYYMAAGCARAGQTDCALDYLRRALNEGFTNAKKVASDVEFASLRDNPAFQQLLAEPHAQ